VPVWQSLLFNHIMPSIFNAAVTLLLVVAIFKVFRVKDPATRFMFLFLPLIKPFIILLENPSGMRLESTDMTVHLMGRLPDPLNLISSPIKEFAEFTYDHSATMIALLIAVIAIFIVITTRWLQLFLFLNGFKHKKSLSKSECPQVYEILDDLVPRLNVAYPKVVVAKNFHLVPFSVGYKEPIIVLSKELLAEFPRKQLEIMLAHELAHMLRKDNLTGWPALILRDIMFFNPFVRLAYNKLEHEKENTCDRIALDITGATPHTGANMLLDVALFYQKVSLNQNQAYPALAKGLLRRRSMLENRITSMARIAQESKPSIVRTSLKTIIFTLLLYLQIGFVVSINEYQMYLR